MNGNYPEMVSFPNIRAIWVGAVKYAAHCHKCDWSLNDKSPVRGGPDFYDRAMTHNRKKGHSVYLRDRGRQHENGADYVFLENLREILGCE